jgi:hypothetical protein
MNNICKFGLGVLALAAIAGGITLGLTMPSQIAHHQLLSNVSWMFHHHINQHLGLFIAGVGVGGVSLLGGGAYIIHKLRDDSGLDLRMKKSTKIALVALGMATFVALGLMMPHAIIARSVLSNMSWVIHNKYVIGGAVVLGAGVVYKVFKKINFRNLGKFIIERVQKFREENSSYSILLEDVWQSERSRSELPFVPEDLLE